MTYYIWTLPKALIFSSKSSEEVEYCRQVRHQPAKTKDAARENQKSKNGKSDKGCFFNHSGARRVPHLVENEQRLSANNLSRLELQWKIHKVKTAEPTFSVLQSLKIHYIFEVDYQTYRLVNSSPKYSDTDSNYIVKLVKKVKSHMESHIFDQKMNYFDDRIAGLD